MDFAIFTMWLQTCGWTDGQTDGLNNEQTDRLMGRQTNEWMVMQHTCKNNDFPIEFAIFTKALRTDGPTNRQTRPLIEMR